MLNGQVLGGKELIKELHKIEPKLQKRALNSAMRSGAKSVLETAKMGAPVDTGSLRDSIAVKKASIREKKKFFNQTGKHINTYMVGISFKEGVRGTSNKHPKYYANIVEFGSVKQAAQPFMTPAMIHNKPFVLNVVKNKLKSAIDRYQKG